jgi:cell division protease FtsH
MNSRQMLWHSAYAVGAIASLLLLQSMWSEARVTSVVDLQPDGDPVQKVSIIPRGISALGYTLQRPTEDRFLMAQDEIDSRMTMLLGGRAAEMLIFGAPSTGATDDLVKATALARASVTRFGMSGKLGLVAYEEESHAFMPGMPIASFERQYSEATAREIDCAVRESVQQAFDRAISVLGNARATLERGARMLLEKETLTEADLDLLRATLPGSAGSEIAKQVHELVRVDGFARGAQTGVATELAHGA